MQKRNKTHDVHDLENGMFLLLFWIAWWLNLTFWERYKSLPGNLPSFHLSLNLFNSVAISGSSFRLIEMSTKASRHGVCVNDDITPNVTSYSQI